MHEHKLLREAMANLHTDAFEQWHLERNDDAQFSGLADDLQTFVTYCAYCKTIDQTLMTLASF